MTEEAAATAGQFSIYLQPWHECWVAATSSFRGGQSAALNKVGDADIDVAGRVAELLRDYGPNSPFPLTLRIYGTLLKGLCVISNVRARALYADCERIMSAFARQQGCSDSSKQLTVAGGKKQQTDAVTLDLDITKVHEHEAFDWTQVSLEEGALLRLSAPSQRQDGDAPKHVVSTVGGAGPSLLEEAKLLDEAFPLLSTGALPDEHLTIVPPVADPKHMASAGEQQSEKPPEQQQQEALLSEMLRQEDQLFHPMLQDPPPNQPEESKEAVSNMVMERLEPDKQKPSKAMAMGHVFGFDMLTELSNDVYDNWQHDGGQITSSGHSAPVDVAVVLDLQRAYTGHLGLLDGLLLGKVAQPLLMKSASTVQPPQLSSTGAEEKQALKDGVLAGSELGVGMLVGSEQAAGNGAHSAKLNGNKGEALRAGLLDAAQRANKDGASSSVAGSPYDEQTAEVGRVIKRCLETSHMNSAYLEDFIPLGATDKATAAIAFASVLALATAGDIEVQQSSAYGPVSISMRL